MTQMVSFKESCDRIAEVIAQAVDKRQADGSHTTPDGQITPDELLLKTRGSMTPGELYEAITQDTAHGL